MKLKIFLMAALIVTSSLLGCNGELDIMSNDPPIEDIEYLIIDGGEVNLPLTPFSTLNPLMTNNTSYHYFSKLIFEGLFEFDENLEAIPRLASSYSLMENGILVGLPNDIYWHDGERLTADDVIYTINAINSYGEVGTYINLMNTALGAFANAGSWSMSARKIDDFNVEISFPSGFSNIKEVLTFPIVPSHLTTSALQSDNYIPIGTGPYMFNSYEKNKSIKLVANTNFRNGEPSISIVMGKVLEDEELFSTAFEAGQIDMTPSQGVDWDKYQQNSRINIIEYVSSEYEFLAFNFRNETFQGEGGRKLRQAINYGIDRQEIIQKILLGHGTATDIPINPISYLSEDISLKYGYNPEKSQEILANLGYSDINSDGLLEDSEGNRLVLKLMTNSTNFYRVRTAQMIAEDLKLIGIDLVLDFNSDYNDNISEEEKLEERNSFNDRIKSGSFDIALLGWNLSTIPELSFLFHTSQIEKDNFIKYENPDLDQHLLELNNSMTNELKIEKYKEVLEIIAEDLPYMSMFFRNQAIIYNSDIRGELNSTYFNPYNGLEKCFMALIPE